MSKAEKSPLEEALRLLYEIRVNLEAQGALDSDYHELFDRVEKLIKSSPSCRSR